MMDNIIYVENIKEFFKNESDYRGSESKLYVKENQIYKIFRKPGKHDIRKIDFLLQKKELKAIAAIPNMKICDKNGVIGFSMDYIDNAEVFYKYVKENDRMAILKMLKLISESLKIINKAGIKLTDLHDVNIIVKDNKPFFVDLDGASMNGIFDSHVASMICKNYDMSDNDIVINKLIRVNNFDRESLFIMYNLFVLNIDLYKMNYKEYRIKIDNMKGKFDEKFIEALKLVKRPDMKENEYDFVYYLSDFLNEQNMYYSLNIGSD